MSSYVDELERRDAADLERVTAAARKAQAQAQRDHRQGWPEARPILRPTQAPTPYPLEALPDSIAAAVIEYQQFGQQPIAMVACSALAIAAAACQGHANVARDSILAGPLSLNFLLIAASGERKTAADRAFSKPLREFERSLRQDWSDGLSEQEAANVVHVAKRQKIEAELKNAKGVAANDLQQALAGLLSQQPRASSEPRIVLGDVTPEALASILATGWPSALLLSDEGGSILGSHATQRESASRFLAMLNSLWDASAPITLDRRSAPSVRVEGRRLSTCIQIQREALVDFLGRTGELARGSGFLARYLIAWPESTAGHRPYREPPAELAALTGFHGRVLELLTQPMKLDDAGRLDPPMLRIEGEAKVAWVEVHNSFEVALGSGEELADVRDVAAKAAENVARLAAVFTLVTGNAVVTAHAITSAARIVLWHVTEARRVLDALGDPAEILDAQALDGWLLTHCRTHGINAITAGDILRLGPSRVRKPERRNAALAVLEEAARIRVQKTGRRERVMVNPVLLEQSS